LEELDNRLDIIDSEEEEILNGGGKLTGSMVGRRRVAATWAVGAASERFSQAKGEIVRRSFRCVGLSLLIDGTANSEISIKGIETGFLSQGLVDCQNGEDLTLEGGVDGLVIRGDENVKVKAGDDLDEDENVFFE